MSGLQRFSLADLPVTPWRNGGGETREIVSWPVGSVHFDWRVSIATIAANGPFSTFAGIDRSITLLSGEGVHLSSAQGVDHPLNQRGLPFAFSGDIPLNATLIQGVTTDFNVMTRRDVCSAQVLPKRTDFAINRSSAGVLYVLQGQWRLAEAVTLSPTEGVFWMQGELQADALPVLALQPEGLVLWVELTL